MYRAHMAIPHVALIALDSEARTAVVCPWCPDYGDTAKWCSEHGLTATHDMCPSCRAQAKAERASRQPFPPA